MFSLFNMNCVCVCVCVRGEPQQRLHLRLLRGNGGRPPADPVSDQGGGLQRGLPVCLQYEKGELSCVRTVRDATKTFCISQ